MGAGERITAIIPSYNRGHLIAGSIDSALAQLDEDDELLVIDDGSTDDTADVAASYGDRLRYVVAPHGGAGATRNRGLAEARQPLVAFLDSDDEWLPGRIRLTRQLLSARPDLGFCFSNFRYRSPERTVNFALQKMWSEDPRGYDEVLGNGSRYSSIAGLPPETEDFWIYEGDLYAELMRAIQVNVNTLLLRRELVTDDVRFAEDTGTWEDWEFTARLARKARCAYLDVELAVQIAHSSPRLTDSSWYETAAARVPILERVWGTDAEFLAEHREGYLEMLEAQHLALAHRALVAGKRAEARAHLGLIRRAPAHWRAVALLPGPLMAGVMKLRGGANK